MADGRRRSAAKQARRDARRRKARPVRAVEQESPEDTPLIDEVRQALAGGQPMDLLGLVSMLILATAPRPAIFRQPNDAEPPKLDDLVAAFIGVDVPETTALLTVLGELVSDEVLRDRCRRAVDTRTDALPRWLAALAQTTVHRVVRMTHVLGDGDDILLGVRLSDGHELTCVVHVDHLEMSVVKDAFFAPEAIGAVVGVAEASNTDPDTTFVDLDVADARIELQFALDQCMSVFLLEESDTWPGCRALVQWLIHLMPAGGSYTKAPQQDSVFVTELIRRFLASPAGLPFDDSSHRGLLEPCIEEGTGDPLRWSATRLRQLLNAEPGYGDLASEEAQLDVPELLSAFVPFVHAESGIRQELTLEALAAIDEMADHYRATVLAEVERLAYVDDDEEGSV